MSRDEVTYPQSPTSEHLNSGCLAQAHNLNPLHLTILPIYSALSICQELNKALYMTLTD